MLPPIVRRMLARVLKSRLVLFLALTGTSFLLSIHSSFALPASPGKVPNGNVFSCNTCHLPDPAPKSENTQMKLDFLNNDPPKTWTTGLANKDSDSDGFTNGEELQDFDGVWAIGQPDPGSTFYVSNPSDRGSVPAPPLVSDIGNFFGSVASGPVAFFVFIDFHALPIDRVEYTIRNSNGETVFTDTATDPTPPFNYLSSQWNTTQVPNGDYTITAEAVEARKKDVVPRSSVFSETFSVHNIWVSFSSGSSLVNESDGTATIDVRLSEPATESITVDYETSDGTASAGSDYADTHGTLEFDIDESSKTISVPILDDNRYEPNETFAVKLFSPSGVTIASPDQTTVTIADDDPAQTQEYTISMPIVVRAN